MKAVVTAGGRGTRLRASIGQTNKHLLPLGSTPVIVHVLDKLARSGIHEIAIATNPNEDDIADVIRNSRLDVDLTFLPITASHGLPEIAAGALDFVGSSPFLFYLGDNVTGASLEHVLADFDKSQGSSCHLALVKGDGRERFGMACIDGNRVVRVAEKPHSSEYEFITAGIYVYSKRSVGILRDLCGSSEAPPDISSFHQQLLDNKEEVSFSILNSWWHDVGTVGDLLAANQQVLLHGQSHVEGSVDGASTVEGAVIIRAGARVVRSKIVGPVYIGERSIIEQSSVGPNVVLGPDKRVIAASIRDLVHF